MAKIIAPNKQYTGISASVSFCNGLGETENPILIEWFKSHNYTVIEEDVEQREKKLEDMTIEELLQYAENNKIDIGRATTQSGIIEKIKASMDVI